MALSANQVQQFYIGYYGRPADPVGLAYWQTQDEAAALAGFAGSAEFTNQLAGLSVTQQVTKVYNNLLGRLPDTEGLLYWAGELTAGRETIGSLVLAMTQNALGKDVTTIENRVEYSNAFTAALDTADEINAYSGPAATQIARDALLKVIANSVGDRTALDAELANVDDTIATIVDGGTDNPGQTFTLTQGADIITGTAGNDTIYGVVGDTASGVYTTTYNALDVIDGGAGNDTIVITVADDADDDAQVTVRNVENFVIKNRSGSSVDFDFTFVTGVQHIVADEMFDDIYIDNMANLPTEVTFIGGGDFDDLDITVLDTAGTGALKVNVVNAGTGSFASAGDYVDLYIENDSGDDVVTAYTINSTGGDFNYLYLNDNDEVDSITVTGNTDLQLDWNSTSKTTLSVDASALTAKFRFDDADNAKTTLLGAQGDNDIATGNGDDTITTYGGNDTINTGNGNNTVNSGAGDDVIAIGTGNDIVNAGAGNDKVIAGDNLATGDLLDGGDGIDTLSLTAAAAVTASGLTGAASTAFQALFTNFEVLELSTALAGNIDLAKLDGMQSVVLAGAKSVDGDRTIAGLASGASIEFKNEATAAADITTVTVTNAAVGTADVLNLKFNDSASADFGVVTAANVETVNINSTTTATDPTTVTNTVDLSATAHTTLNVTGNAALDLSGVALTSVETVAAADFTGGLIISLAGNANDVTVTAGEGDNDITGGDGKDTITIVGDGNNTVLGGAGNDTITITGDGDNIVDGGAGNDTIVVSGSGANTITGGAGLDTMTGGSGVDTYVFAAVTDSQGVTVDVITNFKGGVDGDVLDFSAITGGTGLYLGEANGYGAVLTSLTATAGDAVLDTSTNTLYVDIDGDGALTAADMSIQLTGVTGLTNADNFVW